MKHRYVNVGHNAWAAVDSLEEMSKEIDREILGRIIHDFKPEIGVGDYSIASFKKIFKSIQITKKFDKVISNYSFLSKEEFKAGKPGYVLGNFLIK
jgi:hypothetical protein